MEGQAKPNLPVQGDLLFDRQLGKRVRVLEAYESATTIGLQLEDLETKKIVRVRCSPAVFKQRFERTALAVRRFNMEGRLYSLGIEAFRIRLAHQFDPFFAVSVSKIDPLPHQIHAVYHQMLQLPRIRFLLADDPGAGKTIMAGLLLKELKQRGDIKRLLCIVPAQLTTQWQDELWDKFRENFEIITSATYTMRGGVNPWLTRNQFIVSIDTAARSEAVKDGLEDPEVTWDFVVVDEAHKASAYRYGQKTEETQRYKLVKIVGAKTKHLLFTTATPHKGDTYHFLKLLELLDPHRFASEDILREAVQRGENTIYLRRLKEEMRYFDGRRIFPDRQCETVGYTLPKDGPEFALHEAVTHYVNEYFSKAIEGQTRNVALARSVLQRRLASSTAAILESLKRRRDKVAGLLDEARTQPIQKSVVRVRDEDVIVTNANLDDEAPEEQERLEEEALGALTDPSLLEEELAHLKKVLIPRAESLAASGVDTKLRELRTTVEQELEGKPEEKLLVFTEHKDTLNYLKRMLASWGFPDALEIHGGMKMEERRQAEKDFNRKDGPRILVATEAAGEGINLHYCCRLMVNYDIPWNPMRLEQRMGRIHRYGQRRDVYIWNLVAQNTREGSVLKRLLEKLEIIRKEIGQDRVFDVISDILSSDRLNLPKLIERALASDQGKSAVLEEIDERFSEDAVRTLLAKKDEMLAPEGVNLAALFGESARAAEQRLMPVNIQNFFVEAFAVLCDGVAEERRSDGLIRVKTVPYELRREWEKNHPTLPTLQRSYPKTTFDKNRLDEHPDAEFVCPGHPLFDGVIERTLDKLPFRLQQGARYLDFDAEEPYLIWFLTAAVKDADGEVVKKKLLAIKQTAPDRFQSVPPYVLQDYKPAPVGSDLPPDVRAWTDAPDAVLDYCHAEFVEPFERECMQERENFAKVRRRYQEMSFEYELSQLTSRMNDYQMKNRKGSHDLLISQLESRMKELQAEREAALKETDALTRIYAEEAEVIGVAAILPAEIPSALPEETREAIATDKDIEATGMSIVMRYEKERGCEPEDVSAESLGFDIRSTDPITKEVRRIEVKARAGTGSVVLTANEWTKARQLAEDYWLYVVFDCASTPRLHIVRDPANALPEELVKEIHRYSVEKDAILGAAQEVEVSPDAD